MAKFEYSIRSKDETKAGVESAKSGLRGLEDSMQSINKVARLLMGAGAIAGIVSLFKNIAREANECEQAFAKLHPELQGAAGSLENWTKATNNFKSAAGSIISEVLAPMRSVLTEMLDGWAENITRATTLTTQIELLRNMSSPAAVALANKLADLRAQRDAMEAQQQRWYPGIEAARSGDIGGMLKDAWSVINRGVSGQLLTDIFKAGKQAPEYEKLTREIQETEEALKKLQGQATTLLKDATKPATGAGASGSATALGWLLGPSTGYQAQGMSAWERGNLRFEQMVNDYEVATEKITYSLERLPQELIAEFEAADLMAMANAGAGQYAGGLPPEATAAAAVIAADPIMAAILPFIEQIQSITMLLDPWGTILKSAFDILAPMIDSILAPLAGIFVILGQTLGAVLVPILKWIMPVIQWLGEAFVWLYNNAILPIGNAFIGLFTVLGALGQLIFYIVTFQWGKIGGIKWAPATESLLQPISVGSLGAAGTTAIAGAGATTTYSSGRDITVNVVVNSQVITGDGGFRELALMLNREIENAMALGVV